MTHEMDDHRLAAWLADQAGQLLLALRNAPLDPLARGFVADQTANAFLLSALKMQRPNDHILSEEGPDDPDRLGAERVWIVDPLDGTREYAEGRDDWAVHVALSVGGKAVAGAVAQPARRRIAATQDPAPGTPAAERPVMLVSRTRAPAQAEALASHLGAEIRPMGSAGAKAMTVIAGEAGLYFHAGGQNEWDNCAPVAVAQAAGLIACRIDGSAIRYNQAEPQVPDLLIAHPDIGRRALEWLAGQGSGDHGAR